MLMTVNSRGSGLSTCLFNNDVGDAKSYSSEKRRNPSTTCTSKVHITNQQRMSLVGELGDRRDESQVHVP